MFTKQIADRLKIRSGSDDSMWRWALSSGMFTEQVVDRLKIRSVSDGSAWGWGPTRIK
jgi:phenylalanyl-tRNA synthetase alpha subunit